MLEEEYNKIKILFYEFWVLCVVLVFDGFGGLILLFGWIRIFEDIVSSFVRWGWKYIFFRSF